MAAQVDDNDDDGESGPRPDVLILGAGVIGLACAHYLLQAGRSVHVLEMGAPGGATSFGNCGTITPSHAPPLAAPGMVGRGLKAMLDPAAPFYIRPRLDGQLATWLWRFARRCNADDWQRSARAKGALLDCSRVLIESLVREQGLDCGFVASGLTYVYRDGDALERARRDLPALRELGIDVVERGGSELESAEPCLLPGVAGGLQFPDDAHLRPERYTAELARRVREQGGTIETGVEVDGVETGDGRVTAIGTSRGARRGREVIVALGPWSSGWLRLLGLRMPVQPGKGYSITTARPAIAPRSPLVLKERSVCVTTWEDGFRLGSTMEFSGYDASLNRRRLEAIERAAGVYLREPLGPGPRTEWYGWRPMTWDDLPLLGRAPRLANLWLATAHGMMGMSMSAVTGHLMADLITGRAPILDPSPYSPGRFA
jgi:D-amino-acid dehydrogenase